MTAPPDVATVRAFFTRASRRLTWVRVAEGATGGLAVAIVLALTGWPTRKTLGNIGIATLCIVIGAAIRILIARRRHAPIAYVVERRAPSCRNIVITADELMSGAPVDARVGAVVNHEAARIVRGLDLATLFPARNAVGGLVVALVVWGITIGARGAPAAALSHAIAGVSGVAAGIDGVDVTVTPPAYTGRAQQTTRDPARIETLAGSRVRLSVRSRATNVAIETLDGRDTLQASGAGAFVGELTADADGYISIQPMGGSAQPGAARLIGLSVISDNAPRVRIATPGKDLFLKDAHPEIGVAIEAGDDIGLASLRLRYTKVSGSGERFKFTEGEVPLTIARADARAWTARATWHLDSLGLEPGDLVVYRAVAADRRPNAPASESDSYIAEIVAPGGVAAPGFAIDPDVERYAVSQQMVIVKTERLAAKRASTPQQSFADSAQELAAEQRKVRAEFVFMMGGEIADETADAISDLNEEQEAEGESDLLAGRMANRGRIALLRAIRSMSRAASALTTADLATALPHERAALTQLERAFSHSRIILRALTERERLDLTRRLSGSLTEAASDTRPAAESAPDARVVSLRKVLAGIATLAGTSRLDADAAGRASSLAATTLRVDPSSKPLQDAAALLARAATAVSNGHSDEARDLFDRAATSLAATLRTQLLDAPARGSTLDVDRLGGALNDALRRPRGAP
jgi:hypothetical protein